MSPFSWGLSRCKPPRNLEIDLDILRPYEMDIRAYSKVNIRYFNPSAYNSITKIALFK